jgi:hypothetical protein
MREDFQPITELDWIFGVDEELTIFVTPFMAYHDAFRYVCSLRLHHICVMAMNVGAMWYVRKGQ